MPFSAAELSSDLRFFTIVLGCAREMIGNYIGNPRISAIFASQQRWLMAQVAFALHYDSLMSGEGGFHASRFVDDVLRHDIASHNTALSFLQEMLAYRFARHLPHPSDKRMRPMEPTETAIGQFSKWYHMHLSVLDALDGGERAALLAERPDIIALLQPAIGRGIVGNERVRHPGPTFDLFAWANSGGVLMDYLMCAIETLDPAADRIDIGRLSFADISDRFLISNTHVKRLVTKAAGMDSVGWTGIPGRSHFWLSRRFVQEYWDYQAEKFAIIGTVWDKTVGAGAAPAPTQEGRAISATL